MRENAFELQIVDDGFNDLLSCYPDNRENFAFLIRLMRRNVVIPFLGAGFSANFGYPVWGKFIRELAEKQNLQEVIGALKDNNYEKAASCLKKALGGNMEYVLVKVFGDHVYKAASCCDELEELPRIFRNLILTTNFDEVIEMLYAKVNGEYIEKLTPKSLKDVKVSYKRIACGEPTLIKLHGDVATREFVLTEQEYNEIYGERVLDIRLPLPSFLRDVLLSRIILFMGCSLEDDRTLRVIEQSQIDGSISFALLPLPADTANEADPWKPRLTIMENGDKAEKPSFIKRKAFLNAHNIIPIWYPYGQHDALKLFLKAVVHRVNFGNNLSVTAARNKLSGLLADGDKLKRKREIPQAFYCFAQAERMIESYSEKVFTYKDQLSSLGRIKEFYDGNGYTEECMKTEKDISLLTERVYSRESLELAMCYHDLGFTYERYQYYKLMLKAMQQSQKVLQEYQEKAGSSNAFYNDASMIYTSLGYVYLKNDDKENARLWYQKAEELYRDHEGCLLKKQKAFVLNGLYRYYHQLQGRTEDALQTLDAALELRKELYNEGHPSTRHLINSHSNKIGIYLEKNRVSEAKAEYEACQRDCDVWDKPGEYPDSMCRILTDHGDILKAEGKKQEAYLEYQDALTYRKYLHSYDDLTAAGLYCKMADSLEDLPNHEDKALEYLIQAYVVYEKISGADSQKATDTLQRVYRLGEKMSYAKDVLEQRLVVRREFLQFRYDENMEGREEELIRYFEL